VLRWVFHSPGRLAAVSLVVAAIVVGGTVLAGSRTASPTKVPAPAPAAGAARPMPTAVTPKRPPAPTERVPGSVRREITRAARAFVQTWALGREPVDRTRWLRAVRARTTGSLYRGLRVTDPARLPRGHVRAVDLEEAGPFAGTAGVALSGGLRVEVALVAERGRWLVADVRPAGP